MRTWFGCEWGALDHKFRDCMRGMNGAVNHRGRGELRRMLFGVNAEG